MLLTLLRTLPSRPGHWLRMHCQPLSATRTMPYRVAPAAGEQWAILGEGERSLFSGTWRQCEDWLDRQENLRAARR